jgi:hypothetical protein
MSEFFTTYFFPGPALAIIGVLLAVAAYVNLEGFATAGIELGLSRFAGPAVVNVVAVFFSLAGFCCTIWRRN